MFVVQTDIMHKSSLLMMALTIPLFLFFTGCNSKAKSWNQAQKDKWTESCKKFMNDRGVAQKDAAGFCDCMLKKTSEKYTPEEAVKITPAEEQQLWKQCDYNW